MTHEQQVAIRLMKRSQGVRLRYLQQRLNLPSTVKAERVAAKAAAESGLILTHVTPRRIRAIAHDRRAGRRDRRH